MTFETWTWIFYNKEVTICGKVKNPEEFLYFSYIMATHSSVLAWRIPRTKEPGEPYPSSVQFSRSVMSNFL